MRPGEGEAFVHQLQQALGLGRVMASCRQAADELFLSGDTFLGFGKVAVSLGEVPRLRRLRGPSLPSRFARLGLQAAAADEPLNE